MNDKVSFYINRLRTMSIAEVGFRLRRFVSQQIERVVALLPDSNRFDRDSALIGVDWIRVPANIELQPYLDRADAVLEGYVELLAKQPKLPFPPDWRVNPIGEKKLPDGFGKAINYRDNDRCGDVKYFWILNRHHQLVHLAQAYALTTESKYLSGVKQLLSSWLDSNTYPHGPNWIGAMEVAFRLINWSATWVLIGGHGSTLFEGEAGKELEHKWLLSVDRHCRFVRGYLSRHSSANNHLLGELAGLVVAGYTWPQVKRASAQIEYARQQLEHEVQKQIAPDGGLREQTSFYEHFVAEILVCAALCAERAEEPFSESFLHRLEKMLIHLAAKTDGRGQTVMVGDSDDALVLPLAPGQFECPIPTMLRLGALWFENPGLWHPEKEWPTASTAEWLLADIEPKAKKIRSLPQKALPKSFSNIGTYLLSHEFAHGDSVRVIANLGDLGYLSIAAHGHADALSFVLSINDEPILIDPGTFSYLAHPDWRDYFRSTPAHNTLSVDGYDQAEISGKFMWSSHYRTQCHAFECNQDCERLVGSHNGYERLVDPVRHEREIILDKSAGCLRVIDRIECQNQHTIRRHWHCSPTIDISPLTSNGWLLSGSRSRIEFYCHDGQPHRFYGSTEPKQGWYSDRMDVKEPCHSFMFSSQIERTCELETQIRLCS